MKMLKLIDKLSPCPFCGNTKMKFKNVLTTGMPLVAIECPCGCNVYAPTAHGAVEHWNERTDEGLSCRGGREVE